MTIKNEFSRFVLWSFALNFRPMDLTTIKKNVEAGTIRTTDHFQRDMMLMFTNALMYNNSDQDIHHMAAEMYRDIMANIEVCVCFLTATETIL